MQTKPSINFFGPNEEIASGRYRNIMPFNWLKDNGWEVGKDVLVTMKHRWPFNPVEPYSKYIFDVCDDHFDTMFREHYLKHCNESNLVTCNSEEMSRIIKERTGREAQIIPDPIEYDTQPAHYKDRFLTFGNEWNIALLRNVPNLLKALNGRSLDIISKPVDPSIIPWSREAMIEGFKRAGAVIIPVGNKIAKSANRLLESINAGCFVIANSMPAYDEFKDFSWIGDIAQGIDWYLNNKEEALIKVEAGQRYILDRYTIDKVGPMWEKAIGSC